MNPFDRYPIWMPPGRPTDPAARVCRFRYAKLIRAVRISGASYRNAPVDGVFELFEAEREDPIEVLPSGKRQVKVICAWHGCKPNGGVAYGSICRTRLVLSQCWRNTVAKS